MKAMQLTMEYLCKHIQGCVFGYTQSDEITLILIDYQKLNSDAWFGYEVQKICSISASMATMAFNRYFRDLIEDWPEISRPKVEDRVVRHEDFYEGDEEANRMGWQVMSVSSYYVNNPWNNKEYVGYTRLLRRVPRDINTDKVIYEEG